MSTTPARTHKQERNKVHARHSRARRAVFYDDLAKEIALFGGTWRVPTKPTNNQRGKGMRRTKGTRRTKEEKMKANRESAAKSRRNIKLYREQLLKVAEEVVPPARLEVILARKPGTRCPPPPPSPLPQQSRQSRSPPLFMQFGPDGGSDNQEPLPPSMPTSPTHCYSTPWGGSTDAELLFNAEHERDMDLWFLAAPPTTATTTTTTTTTTTKVVVEVDALGRELGLELA